MPTPSLSSNVVFVFESCGFISQSIKKTQLIQTLPYTEILNVGDASFTLEGGHNYEILEDNTLVYEYKTGPYEGQEFDKIFI